MTLKALFRATRPFFYSLLLEQILLGEILRLTVSSSLEELNQIEEVWLKTCILHPWDDSAKQWSHRLSTM